MRWPFATDLTKPSASLCARSLGLVKTAALLLLLAAPASAFDTKAKQAILLDADSGAVLFAQAPDDKVPPASLAKLMTMEVVFHAVESGEASLDQEYPVSEHAWRTGGAPSGGSTMFAKLKSSIRLSDLMRGVIVQSANDGCIVIAEGLAGSEAAFVDRMNARAKELGLGAEFRNATGLPAEGQFVSMRDLATLALHIAKDHPDFFPLYAEPSFTWNKITQNNRNPLLKLNIGVNGLGTGFTEASGFALVITATRTGQRLVMAMSGLSSAEERAVEARKLLDWGFSAFHRSQLFAAGDKIGSARVFGGEKASLALKAAGSISVLLPIENEAAVTARVVYDGPLHPPVAEGTEVARLQIWNGKTLSQETALFAAESIGEGSLSRRASDAANELFGGWLRWLKRPS